MTDKPFGTVDGDGMRYLLLREIDSTGFPPYGMLIETPDGGARLHVFGGTPADHGLRDRFPDFDAAIETTARQWLVSAAGREGDEHQVFETTPVERQSMTEIALDTRVKLLRAELVADHWRNAYLEWGDERMPARMFAHGLCCVLAALQGETSDPKELGVIPESEQGQHLSGLAENE